MPISSLHFRVSCPYLVLNVHNAYVICYTYIHSFNVLLTYVYICTRTYNTIHTHKSGLEIISDMKDALSIVQLNMMAGGLSGSAENQLKYYRNAAMVCGIVVLC